MGGPSDRKDEGMAHGFENMYKVLSNVYQFVQWPMQIETPSDRKRESIASNWKIAWGPGSVGAGGLLNDKSPFTLDGSDFGAIRSYFGAQIRCEDISRELNQISESGKWCLRFSCNRNEKAGWEIAGNLNNLYIRYVLPPRLEILESLK
jgi:hypothetical protein